MSSRADMRNMNDTLALMLARSGLAGNGAPLRRLLARRFKGTLAPHELALFRVMIYFYAATGVWRVTTTFNVL
jgi:hypothetical protein